MGDSAAVRNVILKHEYASSFCVAMRNAIARLHDLGELQGFTVSDLPPPVDSSVKGFDLSFADRKVRLIFTGSTNPDSMVAIEFWRVPIAYGKEPKNLGSIFVGQDGGFCMPAEVGIRDVARPTDALRLIAWLVGLNTHSVGDC